MKNLILVILLSLSLTSVAQTPTGNSKIVGAIGGTVNVSMYGCAVYSIPLELPDGVNGMQPSIGLLYNSQCGNGLLGYGWNLTGISSITRTGSTLFHDGKMTAADLSDDDRLMLDGQRLIQVGAVGNDVEFKTEQDEFSKVVFHKENGIYSKCDVWTENGNIIKYGYNSNSKLLAAGDTVIKWMVSSIEDRNGNMISYSYYNPASSSDIYIKRILYTSNTQAGLNPEFTVLFEYSDNRFDPYHYYIAGNKVETKLRLDRIDVERQNDMLESYSFTYDANSNRMYNLLTSITFSKGNTSMNPTVIEWNTDQNDIQNNTLSSQEVRPIAFDGFTFTGDFNGDGYTDILKAPVRPSGGYSGNVTLGVYLNNTHGNFEDTPDITLSAPSTLEWVHVLDINDDGYDDIVLQTLQTTSKGPDRTYSSSFIVYESQNGVSYSNVFSTSKNGKILAKAGDFLGEGRNGLLLIEVTDSGNDYYINCYPSILHYNGIYTDDTFIDPIFDMGVVLSDDFTGDGIAELAVFNSLSFARYRFSVQNNAYRITSHAEDFVNYDYASYFSGDFNNDGKADIIFNDQYGYKYVILSTGTGFTDWIRVTNTGINSVAFPQMSLYSYSLDDVSQSSYGVFFADMDGDGKTDMMQYNGNASPLFLRDFHVNTANNQTTGEFKIAYTASNSVINFMSQYFTAGNFLGRDNISFIAVDPVDQLSPSDDVVKVFSLPSVKSVFTAHAITNGMGVRTEFGYGYMMPGNSGLYSFANRPAVNGIRPFTMPLTAMQSYTEFIDGHSYTTGFHYTNALLHKTGRGFLGFDAVTRTTLVDSVQVTIEKGCFETLTMGVNAVALPAADSVFFCADGVNTLTETDTYSFYGIRCGRSLQTDGRMLVTRPAIAQKKTKKFNPDSQGGLLSVAIDDYIYSYNPAGNTYSDTYRCIEIANGVNVTDCASAAACQYRNTQTITFCQDDYANWVINRKLEVETAAELGNKTPVVRTTSYAYSAANPFNISSITVTPGTNPVDPLTTSTTYTYNGVGNVVTETLSVPYSQYNEQAVVKQYVYANSRLVSGVTTDPSGLAYQESYVYDTYDRMVRHTAANGLVTTYSYVNPFGSATITTAPDGIVAYGTTDWCGNDNMAPAGALYKITSSNDEGAATTTYHGASGDILRTVRLNHLLQPVIKDVRYTKRGLACMVSNPYLSGDTTAWTSYSYDKYDRVTQTLFPNGKTINNTYSGYTTVTTVITDSINRSEQRTVNPMGWLVESQDAAMNEVLYDYNPDGTLASSTTSGGGVVVSMGYDSAGNRTTLDDPDYGQTTSRYDAYGRLMSTVTPKGDRFAYTYDVMGRLTRRDDMAENVYTLYQYNENSHKGTLASVTHDGQSITYSYDMYDRKTSVSETRGNDNYTTSYVYDIMSRPRVVTYPTDYQACYSYYPNGVVEYIRDRNNHTLWHTDDINAFGSVTGYTTGNGLVTGHTYDTLTNMLVQTTTSGGLQNMVFAYDQLGNMTSRLDSLNMLSESFRYDNLDRLTTIHCGSNHSAMTYDSYGRMTGRQRDGGTVFESATFSNSKPHAMTGADAPPGVFPENEIVYYSFDKVKKISQHAKTATFTYGYDRQRMTMSVVDTISGACKTKTYVGNCEYVTENGSSRELTYLTGPCGVFAVVTNINNNENISYICKDNLGSWTALSGSTGTLKGRMSYDAWGNLRNSMTWSGTPSRPPLFDRGFTGHEHLWDFGLINMNGRMYDPLTASFLSPDNNVQDPTSQQGFNRYAYCAYNPLKYVDPSGYRYYGYDEGAYYRMIDEMTRTIQREWHLVYESAMESAQLTISMACCLYGYGQDTHGNGSGNHGSPGGGSQTPYVDVHDNGDGTYTVVGGVPNEDCSVYVVDDQGNRTYLGTMLTSNSFFDKYDVVVSGAIIYSNCIIGQLFLNDVINNTPNLYTYGFDDVYSGRHDKYYDFKSWGSKGLEDYELLCHYNRGMMIDYGDGIYIATARDIGNFAAGFIAAENGLSFTLTRILFDIYQGGIEPRVSRYAQNKGFLWGLRYLWPY